MEREDTDVDEDSPFFDQITLRGFRLPSRFNLDVAKSVMDYLPDDGEIILCSYVKTGSTLLQYIMWFLLNTETQLQLPRLQEMLDLTRYNPTIEMPPSKQSIIPRFHKHHFPYNLLQVNKKAKYIYLYRNPADVLSAYYHFFSHIFDYKPKSIDYFVERFVEGTMHFGSYFDHVQSFYKHKTEPHVLMISFEKLLEDKRNQILKVAQFLGAEYYNKLLENDDLLQKIVEKTEFEYMQSNIDSNIIMEGVPVIELKMFRKGVIGDGKTLLTPEQMRSLKNKIQEKFEGTDILNEWLIYF